MELISLSTGGPLYATCHLMAGLANQMFQIAATIGYASRLQEAGKDIRVILPPTTAQDHTRKESYNQPGEMLSRPMRGRVQADRSQVLIHQEQLHGGYQEIPIPQSDRERVIVLVGYFQTFRYFDSGNARRAVHQAFRPFPDFETRMAARFAWLDDHARPRVAIHVRRGDYLLNQHIFTVLPVLYYAKARFALAAALGIGNPDRQIHWVVFSDDIAWCRQNLGMAPDTTFIDEDISDQDLLWLMSLCDHHIIANSSFSWWGAVLKDLSDTDQSGAIQQSDRHVVVAPGQWFTPRRQAAMKMADRYPPGWIVIS